MSVRGRVARLAEFDVLAAASLIWFLGQFTRFTFPPLFETFRGAYGVSNTALGALFTLLLFAYAGMQFPSGALADRVGMARVIAAGALVLSVAALSLFAWQAFPALVAAMVLIGIGTGAHKTVAINLLSAVYPERTGRALGAMDGVGQLGGMAAPAAVVFVLSIALGWNVVFLAVGIVGAALAWLFYGRARRRLPPGATRAAAPTGEAGNADDTAGRGARTYLSAFAEPRFVLFAVVAVAFSFTWGGLSAFLPLYLASEKGLSSSAAGLLYSGVFLASLVQPVTGALADRVGRLRVVLGTLGLATAGLVALLAAEGRAALAVVVLLVGVGIHGFRPVRDAHLVETIPPSVAGGTLGIVRTAMMVVGSTAPTVVGYLSDAASFAAAFGLLAAVLGIGVGLAVVLHSSPAAVSRAF